jgi:glutamyl/glutaminyl-tRNA synthetase
VEKLYERLTPFLDEPLPEGRELLAVEAVRDEMRLLSDAPWLVREITGPVDPCAFVSELPESSEEVYTHVELILEERVLEDLGDAREFVRELRTWAKHMGFKTRELLHPLRLALTGRSRGPEMAYLFALLGACEARVRIQKVREARLWT